MKIYALCDAAMIASKNITLEDFIKRCYELDVQIIQYRNKNSDISVIKNDLVHLRKLWDRFLIINDYYELSSFCDGVHIGQDDIASIDANPQKAIKILQLAIGEDKIIGLSTHNADEIKIANTLDINYIGLGAYRATATKDDASVLAENLDELAASSIHPVGAIGGVRLDDKFKNVTYLVVGSGLF